MSQFSTVDPTTAPPVVTVPRDYNATVDLIDVNLVGGRGDRVAVVDDAGTTTYAELARRINRCGNALKGLGLRFEQRIVMLQQIGRAHV